MIKDKDNRIIVDLRMLPQNQPMIGKRVNAFDETKCSFVNDYIDKLSANEIPVHFYFVSEIKYGGLHKGEWVMIPTASRGGLEKKEIVQVEHVFENSNTIHFKSPTCSGHCTMIDIHRVEATSDTSLMLPLVDEGYCMERIKQNVSGPILIKTFKRYKEKTEKRVYANAMDMDSDVEEFEHRIFVDKNNKVVITFDKKPINYILESKYFEIKKAIEDYEEQIKVATVRPYDIPVDTKVKTLNSNGEPRWVHELKGNDVLLRTTEKSDDDDYDDFWVHIAEIRLI